MRTSRNCHGQAEERGHRAGRRDPEGWQEEPEEGQEGEEDRPLLEAPLVPALQGREALAQQQGEAPQEAPEALPQRQAGAAVPRSREGGRLDNRRARRRELAGPSCFHGEEDDGTEAP